MKTRDVLKDDYEFWLGNGNSSLWHSPWTNYGNLSTSVVFVDIHDYDLCVNDLIRSGGGILRTYTLNYLLRSLIKLEPFPLISTTMSLILSHGQIILMVCISKSGYSWIIDKQVDDLVVTPTSWNWI